LIWDFQGIWGCRFYSFDYRGCRFGFCFDFCFHYRFFYYPRFRSFCYRRFRFFCYRRFRSSCYPHSRSYFYCLRRCHCGDCQGIWASQGRFRFCCFRHFRFSQDCRLRCRSFDCRDFHFSIDDYRRHCRDDFQHCCRLYFQLDCRDDSRHYSLRDYRLYFRHCFQLDSRRDFPLDYPRRCQPGFLRFSCWRGFCSCCHCDYRSLIGFLSLGRWRAIWDCRAAILWARRTYFSKLHLPR